MVTLFAMTATAEVHTLRRIADFDWPTASRRLGVEVADPVVKQAVPEIKSFTVPSPSKGGTAGAQVKGLSVIDNDGRDWGQRKA